MNMRVTTPLKITEHFTDALFTDVIVHVSDIRYCIKMFIYIVMHVMTMHVHVTSHTYDTHI